MAIVTLLFNLLGGGLVFTTIPTTIDQVIYITCVVIIIDKVAPLFIKIAQSVKGELRI